MKHLKALFVGLCLAAALGSAQTPSSGSAADKTKVNKLDQNAYLMPADQQNMNVADQEWTRVIRKAIIADKSLSTYSQNVKIITIDVMVTLKGPVKSDSEKKIVMAKAVEATHSAEKVTEQTSVQR